METFQKNILMDNLKEFLIKEDLRVIDDGFFTLREEDLPVAILKEKDISIQAVGEAWRNSFSLELSLIAGDKKMLDILIFKSLNSIKLLHGVKKIHTITFEKEESQNYFYCDISLEITYHTPPYTF